MVNSEFKHLRLHSLDLADCGVWPTSHTQITLKCQNLSQSY